MALWWIKETDTTLREWDRDLIKRLIPGPSIGPEPAAKVVIGGKTLFPLTDAGPQPPAGQKLASRTVTDDGDVATAGYVYEDKTAAELAAERAPFVEAMARLQHNDTLERKAQKAERAGDGLGALKLRLQKET